MGPGVAAMDTIHIGPLVLDAGRLFVFVAFAALVFGARLSERRLGPEMGPWAWRVGIWALVGGRLVYVLLHAGSFAADPFSALYVWQGGFSPSGAAAAATAVTLWSFRGQRRHLAAAGALLAGSALLLTALYAVPLGPDLEGRVLPEIHLEAVGGDRDGEQVSLARWKGRPLVVNLWATWCPPCRRELPLLEEYARREGEAVLLLVDQGEGREEVASYLSERGLSFPHVFLDPGRRLAATFESPGLPTTLVFDAQGRLVAARMGEVSRAWLDDQFGRFERDE